jgi:hypothetical protein
MMRSRYSYNYEVFGERSEPPCPALLRTGTNYERPGQAKISLLFEWLGIRQL